LPYYPILKAPFAKGFTTLANFPPNNWEIKSSDKFVNVSWASGGVWNTKNLGLLGAGKFRSFTEGDLKKIVPEDAFPLLSLTSQNLPNKSSNLPSLTDKTSILPISRATIGLKTKNFHVSYQGEINQFPAPASLLSFCPLIQIGDEIKNYLLFLNLEKSAVLRFSEIEIFDSKTLELRYKTKVENNRLTVISLDGLSFNLNSLPLVVCREMSGIPLFYSTSLDGNFLSLEHTHPPASFVIHGRRLDAQKILKQKWLAKLL
jgi:hypothetical protein